jgi:hypothetical protein
MIEIRFIHVWKCHNKTHYFVQFIYTNKKIQKQGVIPKKRKEIGVK